MKVLILGAGCREHIIANRLAEDSEVYAIMNVLHPGISKISKEYLVVDYSEVGRIKEWIEKREFDVGFVSPDGLLAKGLSDLLKQAGVPIASPLKQAAKLEWHKGYARDLMKKNNIEGVPKYKAVFGIEEALGFIKENKEFVIKPFGLTGGKGVKVKGEHFHSEAEGLEYIKELIDEDEGALLEEKLEGPEFSLQGFSNGRELLFMPPVQDHKRAYEQDIGPNTGGMGSYSTGKLLPFMNEKDLEDGKGIMRKVMEVMRKENNPFVGILYGNFMVTKDGIKLIEFNARFGDPEAMNVLSLLGGSLSSIFLDMCREGELKGEFSEEASLVKYVVPEGYPVKGKKGEEIEIDEKGIKELGCDIYYGSVYSENGKVYTTPSRTAAVVGKGKDLYEVEKRVEKAISFVRGNLFHRKDIGTKELVEKKVEYVKRLKRNLKGF
ncbi:phosphoribosylamine--glycine ligase [Candidatus Micrarchaeota archaeon]|nr:phosphoribosylamine--glycine ligase [Candidatus Micrarchaeota archaeon]